MWDWRRAGGLEGCDRRLGVKVGGEWKVKWEGRRVGG